MADSLLTKIDLRSISNPVGVINDPLQAFHSKIEQSFVKKMFVERKHVSHFEKFLKEIDFTMLPVS